MRRRTASFIVIGIVVVVAAAVAGGLAATGGSSPKAASSGSARTPVTILWIGDTTGPIKLYGNAQLAGVRGAADYFNSHGGIDGHPVVVHAVSDNGDATTAASVLTQQLESGLPTMVWPGSVTADSGALIPILARYKVFAIALTDGAAQCRTNASSTCPNEWVLTDSSSVAPQAAADWIKGRHLTKVGVLEESTAYSAAETPEFQKAASANGLTVRTTSFPASAVDLTPQMQELKESGAQVIYCEGLGTAQYAFRARADLSWDVPLVFDPPASSLDLTKLTTAANLKDTHEVTLYEEDPGVPNPGVATMVKWAKRYANVLALPLNSTSTGWDAVVTLNAAVHQAGGALDVDSLNTAMLKLAPSDPLRTLTHKLGYSRDNHENVLGTPEDYVVIPVGPLVNGRVKAQ